MLPYQVQFKARWVCEKIAYFLYDYRVPAADIKNDRGYDSLKLMLALLIRELLVAAGLSAQEVADVAKLAFSNTFDHKTATFCFECLFQGKQSICVDQNRQLACTSAATDAAQWLWHQERNGNLRASLIYRTKNFADNPFLFYTEAACYRSLQDPENIFIIFARLAQKQNQLQRLEYSSGDAAKEIHFLLRIVFNDVLPTAIHPICNIFFDGRKVSFTAQALSVWWLGLDGCEDDSIYLDDEQVSAHIVNLAEKFAHHWRCVWLVPGEDLSEEITLIGQQLYSKSRDLFVSARSQGVAENLDLFDFPRRHFWDNSSCSLSYLELLRDRLQQLLQREQNSH